MTLSRLALAVFFLMGVAAFNGKSPTSQSSATDNTIWVSKSDGAMSCTPGSGEGLDKGKSILGKSNIEVFEAKKGNDGKARIAMCGVAQGSLNMYRISKDKLAEAQRQGFELVLAGAR